MANKKDEFCFMCGSKVDDVDKLIKMISDRINMTKKRW